MRISSFNPPGLESSVRQPFLYQLLLHHPLFIPVCILVGLGIRLGVAIWLPVEPYSDAAWYVARAQELVAGVGYQEDGHPTAYWPIGWPAILAGGVLLFGSVPTAVLALNTVAAATIMWQLLLIARAVGASEGVARLALLLYALYPSHIAYHGVANSETVYLAVFMVAFNLLIKGRDNLTLLVVSGLFFGVATLIKPQTLAFPLGGVIALGMVFQGFTYLKVLRAGLIIYLSLLLVVLPWSYRNQSVFGEFVLVSTNGGVALFMGANDQLTGSHFNYQHTPVFQQLGIDWEERVERQVELNLRQKQAAKQWISDNTGKWMMWMPVKIYKLWYKDTDGFWNFQRQYQQGIIRAFQVINQFYYIGILLLSLLPALLAARSFLRADGEEKRLGLLFCVPVFASLVAAVFTGQIRYHHAAMPYLVVAAAMTLQIAWQKRRRPV